MATQTKQSATDKALNTFADLMIEKIMNISEDWHKPWFSETSCVPPRNLSGRFYNGSNSFMLMLKAEKEGYELPVWGTFDRFKAIGNVSVNKGEKSFPVFLTCFTVVNPETKEKIKYDVYKEMTNEQKSKYNVFPSLHVYNVFNIAQTNLKDASPDLYDKLKAECGVKPDSIDENRDTSSHPAIDAMIDNNLFLCPIKPTRGDDAYYSISNDEIVIPLREQFKDGESFASNTLHECSHALGAEGRLNRLQPATFGSAEYAREELIAEMTAAVVASHFGLCKHIKEDSAAYLKSWLSSIKKSPTFIKTVLADVKRASAMLEARIIEIDAALKADNMLEYMKQGFDAYHESKVHKA